MPEEQMYVNQKTGRHSMTYLCFLAQYTHKMGTTVICFLFVAKIFSDTENVRKYFTRINFTTKIFARWLAPVAVVSKGVFDSLNLP